MDRSSRNAILMASASFAILTGLAVFWFIPSGDADREPPVRDGPASAVGEAAATPLPAPPASTAAIAAVAFDPAFPTGGVRGSVSGSVVDALGDPIGGAEVWITGPPDRERAITRTTTDAAGLFVLEPLPTGDWFQVRGRAPRRSDGTDYVSLPPERPRDTAFLQLWDAAAIRALVVDAGSGAPVPGAQVCAAYDDSRVFGFDAQAEAVTDAAGRCELPGVPLGEIKVRAAAVGYVLATETVRLAADSELKLSLARGPGMELVVTTTGLDQEGLASARVGVIAYHSGSAQVLPSHLLSGSLDGEGRWRATGLPDHEFHVGIHADGWSFQPRERRIKPGSQDRVAGFEALRDGAVVIGGLLKHRDGRPLPGESIVCRAANGGRRSIARTGADGAFSMNSPLAPGEGCVLYLTGSGHVLDQPKDPADFNSMDMRARHQHRTVIDTGARIELVAVDECRVLGRVVIDGGRPVPHAEVTLEHAHPNHSPKWMTFAWTTADPQGNYVFEGLHPVEDELRVAVADRAGAGISRTFTLPPRGDAAGIDVAITPAGTVAGTVRDPDGRPLPGARVWLREADEETKSRRRGNINESLADRNGRYRFTGVGPGMYRLSALFDEAAHRQTRDRETSPIRMIAGGRLDQDVTIP